MARLAGVTFRKIGKLSYYAADDLLVLAVGSRVIAESESGMQCGEVKILRDVSGGNADAPSVYRLLRVATDADLQVWEKRQARAENTANTCRKCAEALRLPLKIVDTEAAFDGSGMTFYFVSDDRFARFRPGFDEDCERSIGIFESREV